MYYELSELGSDSGFSKLFYAHLGLAAPSEVVLLKFSNAAKSAVFFFNPPCCKIASLWIGLSFVYDIDEYNLVVKLHFLACRRVVELESLAELFWNEKVLGCCVFATLAYISLNFSYVI